MSKTEIAVATDTVGTEPAASGGTVKLWPTVTAKLVSILGGVGLISSLVAATLQYFQLAGMISAVAMVVTCMYVLAVPDARAVARGRSETEQLADAKASALGFALPFLAVVITLLVLEIRVGDEPLVVPARFFNAAIIILVAPIFIVPLIHRVWRKR